MIAALFVDARGPYVGLEGVDPWPLRRDARKYEGPWPVVAHPPCARWCRLAKQVEHRERQAAVHKPFLPGFTHGRSVGEDGGTFAAALAAVRRWGGVLEHPAGSLAWRTYHLAIPERSTWTRSDVGWACAVSQAAYGHRAPKLTWLYYVGAREPAPLDWSRPPCRFVVTTTRGRRPGGVELLDPRERSLTPLPFRDALLGLARGAR